MQSFAEKKNNIRWKKVASSAIAIRSRVSFFTHDRTGVHNLLTQLSFDVQRDGDSCGSRVLGLHDSLHGLAAWIPQYTSRPKSSELDSSQCSDKS